MNRSVLICDDDTHIRCILAAKLRAAGWTVFEARDGEEGYDAARANLPALVLTDYQMPGTDGMAMTQRLAAEPATRAIPVIMLTARGHNLDDGDKAKTNIRAVIDKPFSAKQVLACVEQVMAEGAKESPNADAA